MPTQPDLFSSPCPLCHGDGHYLFSVLPNARRGRYTHRVILKTEKPKRYELPLAPPPRLTALWDQYCVVLSPVKGSGGKGTPLYQRCIRCGGTGVLHPDAERQYHAHQKFLNRG